MMAKDALGLVNSLGWDRFHVVGESMGGMIAQELALLVSHRILTLTLVSTHAGYALPPVFYRIINVTDLQTYLIFYFLFLPI